MRRVSEVWCTLLLLCVAARPLVSQAAPPKNPTVDLPRAQQEQFLLNAQIVSERPADAGITHTFRATLSDGRMTHDAHVQSIDIYRPEYKTPEGVIEKNFRDSYKYNIAAYRVDRMLDFGMSPTCVYRVVSEKPSSVCWWIDNIQFDELKRREKKAEAPDNESWVKQLNLVRVFDQLIDNEDRNQGNLLIDQDWRVWMIDHSRSFRVTTQLRNPKILRRVSQRMLDGMRRMTLAECNAQLKPFLTDEEIRTLLVRRDLLLKFFADAVTEKGADAVFTDMPRSTPHVTIP